MWDSITHLERDGEVQPGTRARRAVGSSRQWAAGKLTRINLSLADVDELQNLLDAQRLLGKQEAKEQGLVCVCGGGRGEGKNRA